MAREFLKEACDIEYWKLHRQYSVVERVEPHEDRYLAADALKGLALSGLPEAMEVITSMKQWDRGRVNPWAGALSDAAKYFDYSKEPDHWKHLFLTDDEKMKKCRIGSRVLLGKSGVLGIKKYAETSEPNHLSTAPETGMSNLIRNPFQNLIP